MEDGLKSRVENFLRSKGITSLGRLDIEVDGSQVTLRGTVRSFYERQLCICCQQMAGVSRLIDQLHVEVSS